MPLSLVNLVDWSRREELLRHGLAQAYSMDQVVRYPQVHAFEGVGGGWEVIIG